MLRLVFYVLAVLSVPLALVVGIMMTALSGQFIRVHDITFDPATGMITMQRNVLSRSDVLARWHMAVQLPDGRECSDRGEDIYEPVYVDGTEKTSATFPAGPLEPCLSQPDAQIVANWQVLWMGFIPLKPTWFFKPPRE